MSLPGDGLAWIIACRCENIFGETMSGLKEFWKHRMDSEKTFQNYQPLLFSLAYNMLGSVMDAEDSVQETFLRWHRACKSGEQEAIRSPRSYLCTIVTHICIDYLRSARVKRETSGGAWLPEPLLTSSPDEQMEMAEILSVASLRLLETLSPAERAAFLLHQIFDYEYVEIARLLGKSEHSCRQLVYRAKQHLASRRPRYEVSSQQQKQFYQHFLQASANGDMEGLLHLLAEDVVLYSDGGELRRPMPLSGAKTVAHAMLEVTRRVSLQTTWRGQISMINGRPGVVIYAYGRLYAVLTLELVDGRIQEIDFIVNPEKLRHLRQSEVSS